MGDFTISLGSDIGAIFILLLVLVIILAAVTVFISIRLMRLTEKYKRFMKGKDGKTMERVISDRLNGLARVSHQINENKNSITNLKTQVGTSLTHYGIVKYDAFDDVGGKLSFALAMLDDSNSGFVLNTIHSRDNCFQYIKEIVNGESYIMLSNEEMEALNNAITVKEENILLEK